MGMASANLPSPMSALACRDLAANSSSDWVNPRTARQAKQSKTTQTFVMWVAGLNAHTPQRRTGTPGIRSRSVGVRPTDRSRLKMIGNSNWDAVDENETGKPEAE